MKNPANIASMRDKFPFRNTSVQLAFEAELQRVYTERGEPMADIINKLAKLSGVESRQIYNYRTGKTAISPEQIKIFCEQFNSVALGIAWISTFDVNQESIELYDLSRFASRSVRNVLQAGDDFLDAFEDNKIDGFEMNKLELAAAKIHRDTVLMVEVARGHYKRHHVG